MYDPEILINIWELGLIYRIDLLKILKYKQKNDSYIVILPFCMKNIRRDKKYYMFISSRNKKC